MALPTAAAVVWASAAALGAAAGLWLASIAAALLVLRPRDGRPSRAHAAPMPVPIFKWHCWAIVCFGELLQALKPAPFRLAEMASAFTQSQVLFALSNLGVPDLLAAHGPMTAHALAAGIAAARGGGSSVSPTRLERLLEAATAMGMLARIKPPASGARGGSWGRLCDGGSGAAPSRAAAVAEEPGSGCDAPFAVVRLVEKAPLGAKAATAGAGAEAAAEAAPPAARCYTLNAVSSALVSSSRVCMSSFVKLLEDDYAAMGHLSEGLLTNKTPFEIRAKGQNFWSHLSSSERHAMTFDAAMQQKHHIGGSAAAAAYPFRSFDTLIDVAGGVGTFTAAVLGSHPGVHGIVLDQQQQISRAQQVWAAQHASLLPRVRLLAGDMFNAATIPAPPEGSAAVVYVLHDVLHNWPDSAAVQMLAAIRQAVARGEAASVRGRRVVLLLLETTLSEELLPCHMHFRCSSDMLMYTLFDGQERTTAQFRQLLAAAGWTLRRLLPSSGIFNLLEAVPAA